MEVGQLVKAHAKKKTLQKQRDALIQQELKRKQKEKINLDQSAVKKGYIQKHKIIAKKQYDTLVQKTKKLPVEIQDNANPNTYLSRNANFVKILARTKQRVELDQQTIKNALSAVNAYGIAHKQHIINFTLRFEQEIQCEPKPFLMYWIERSRNLPFPQACQKVYIILPSVKEKEEGQYSFEKIKSLNLQVVSSSEFINKFKNDVVFSKKVFQQQIKCFVKFQIFKTSKFYQGLLRKGVPVFPIDSKKVPFSLQDELTDYPEYIAYMSKPYLAVSRSGQQQTFRLKTGVVDHLAQNSVVIIHELTAKLIERSKVKQNKLLRVSAKTASSINFDIYQSQ